jgi:hypothetical protein
MFGLNINLGSSLTQLFELGGELPLPCFIKKKYLSLERERDKKGIQDPIT